MATIAMNRARPAPAFYARLRVLSHCLLALGFFVYSFIGTSPLAEGSAADRVAGNALDRLVVIGLAGLAMIVLWMNRSVVLPMLARSAGTYAVVAIALLSVTWSDHPDLTLRRAILLACLAVIAAGVAAGVRDLRSFHTLFCCALTAVVLANLVIVFAMPAYGMSEIGAKGLYSQKNVAGMVAMIAVLAVVTWAGAAPVSAERLLAGAAMLVPAAGFLLLTESKTSIGLTLMAVAGLAVLALAARGGPRVALALLAIALCGIAAGICVLAAYDFDVGRLADAVLGDTSFTGRDELWAFAYRAAMERPWLGHGYGAFWDVGVGSDPLLRVDPGNWLGDVETGIINQAHNGYLELWLHLGLPATILATLTVAAAIVAGAWRIATLALPGGARAALCFLVGFLVLYLLHNLTEASLFMRGIVLGNIALLALFLLARAKDFSTRRTRRVSGADRRSHAKCEDENRIPSQKSRMAPERHFASGRVL